MLKIKNVSLILSVLIMSFLVGYIVLAWTEPGQNPPGGNVSAPLNVGIDAQSKLGALVVGYDSNVTTGLIVRYGNVGINQTSPGRTLDVSGTGRFTGALTLGTQASLTSHAVRADRTITAGTGLSGGGNLTDNRTISADTTYLQRRVSGTCASDQAIRVINTDGTVTLVYL